ncbi:MAG: hypothetical protein Ta2F_18140 [Termitinemataceae bacterium]|nr:MAG: hypothetical protein Ta2F_18140 [Termitinemataceae bacterium]
MQKKIFLVIFIFFIASCTLAFSRERSSNTASFFNSPMDFGIGVDFNGYAENSITYAIAVSALWRFMNELSAGLRFGVNFDFDVTKAIEISSVVNWFFIRSTFFEGFLGAELGYASVSKSDITNSSFIAAVNAGCRFLFANGKRFPPWYLEPHARFGFNFLWDAGFAFGFKLPKRR